jgi:hypothetical protein
MVIESYGDQRVRSDAETEKVFTDRGWTKHAGGYILLPPNSRFDAAAFDARSRALDTTAHTWDDIVRFWESLGYEPSPDAALTEFCR